MEIFNIINDVSPRSAASMYSDSIGDKLLAGQTVNVITQQAVTETINGESYLIIFLQLEDNRWIPEYLPYTGKYYAEEAESADWYARIIVEKPDGESRSYVLET